MPSGGVFFINFYRGSPHFLILLHTVRINLDNEVQKNNHNQNNKELQMKTKQQTSIGSVNMVYFLQYGAHVNPRKLNLADWHEIFHTILHWLSFDERYFEGTILPDNKALKKNPFGENLKFYKTLNDESDCEMKDIEVRFRKSPKDIDFLLDSESKLIPLCPVSTNGSFSEPWTKNNLNRDHFIFKVHDKFYGWVLMTRTVSRIKRSSAGGTNCWDEVSTKAYSYGLITPEDLEKMILQNPNLGVRIIARYINYFESEIKKKDDLLEMTRKRKDIALEMFGRLGRSRGGEMVPELG